jgi:hypothetical protein
MHRGLDHPACPGVGASAQRPRHVRSAVSSKPFSVPVLGVTSHAGQQLCVPGRSQPGAARQYTASIKGSMLVRFVIKQMGRCSGGAEHVVTSFTRALRAGVLRRAIGLARPVAVYTAAASAGTAKRLLCTSSSRCALNTKPSLVGSNYGQRRGFWPTPRLLDALPPNMSVNRRRHGRPAGPRDRHCSSSAARPGRPAASPRLPLR